MNNKKFNKKKRPRMLFVNDRENETLQSLLMRILGYLERYIGAFEVEETETGVKRYLNGRNEKYSEEPLKLKTKSIPEILVISEKSYKKIKELRPDIISDNKILGMKIKTEN